MSPWDSSGFAQSIEAEGEDLRSVASFGHLSRLLLFNYSNLNKFF